MRRRQVRGWTACWIAMLVGAGCARQEPPASGGETHWLDACATDRECGDEGLICRCGTCTRSCPGDAACGGAVEAACYAVASPALQQRCADATSGVPGGICLGRCTGDADCAGANTCVQGACVPRLGAAPISKYDEVSSEVSWSEPVAVPDPVFTIAGGDDRIIGTWLEQPCPSDRPFTPIDGGILDGSVCVRLVIGREASGEISGTLTFESTVDATYRPYAPPEDPDVGYPTELDPYYYYEAFEGREPNIPYRLFDARFQGGRLRASWSTADLWSEWCGWQTPYRWTVDGQARYFCVPQDPASWATIDPGKLELCSPLELGPLCETDQGYGPCKCLLDPASGCGREMCRCDRERCGPDLGLFKESVQLVLAGNRLTGTWQHLPFEDYPLVMERVSP